MKKKIIALGLALLLGTPLVAGAVSGIPEDYSKSALESAVKNGLLQGNTNGDIMADKALTRVELATILVNAFGSSEKADIPKFTDVKMGQ